MVGCELFFKIFIYAGIVIPKLQRMSLVCWNDCFLTVDHWIVGASWDSLNELWDSLCIVGCHSNQQPPLFG